MAADLGRRNLTNLEHLEHHLEHPKRGVWPATDSHASDSEQTDSCSSSDAEREPLHNSNQTYMTEAPYTPTHQGNQFLSFGQLASGCSGKCPIRKKTIFGELSSVSAIARSSEHQGNRRIIEVTSEITSHDQK